MRESERIHIKTSRQYDYLIGPGLDSSCGAFLREVFDECRIAVITDSRTANLYLKPVMNSLEKNGFSHNELIVKSGEKNKNLSAVSSVIDFLLKNGLSKNDAILVLGGGMLCDLAGFAASVYMRGIKRAVIPTTMLCAEDASVGGRTSLNLEAGKNILGTVSQPSMVICDTNIMNDLPEGMLREGAAEAIKTGIACSESLFSMYEKEERDTVKVIAECVRIKTRFAEEDPLGLSENTVLSLGHTIGHAIEKCTEYDVTHGDAVAAGVSVVTRAGMNAGITDFRSAARILNAIRLADLPLTTDIRAESLVSASVHGKNADKGCFSIVIPVKVGECTVRTMDPSQFTSFIKSGL